MTDEHTSEVKKHLKTYLGVFVALMVLTIVTVGVAGLKVGVALSVTLALIIATVKGSLVGAFFMHLAWEKRTIHTLLLMAAGLFFSMMALLIWSLNDPLTGTENAPLEAAATEHPESEGH